MEDEEVMSLEEAEEYYMANQAGKYVPTSTLIMATLLIQRQQKREYEEAVLRATLDEIGESNGKE